MKALRTITFFAIPKNGLTAHVVVDLGSFARFVASLPIRTRWVARCGLAGAMLGLLLGAMLLAGLLTLGHTARLLLALVSLFVALAAINLAPDNPYFSLPPQLTSGRPSHFLSFSAILRALSELWPLIALSYLCVALWRSRSR